MQPYSGEMPALIDATVLSHFAAVNRLDLLQAYAPDARVATEVGSEIQDGVAFGYSFLSRVTALFKPPNTHGWLVLTEVSGSEERTFFNGVLRQLQAGEAASLAIAAVRGWHFITDDRSAREFAQANGISLSGTIGVLIWHIRMRNLSVAQANVLLDQMIRVARYRSPVRDLRELPAVRRLLQERDDEPPTDS